MFQDYEISSRRFHLQSRCINLRLYRAPLDFVLYSVEKQLLPQKLKQITFDAFRDIRLEVYKVKVRLIIDLLAFCRRNIGECRCKMQGKIWDWIRVCGMIGRLAIAH